MISSFLQPGIQYYQQMPIFFLQQVQVIPTMPNMLPLDIPFVRNECLFPLDHQKDEEHRRKVLNQSKNDECQQEQASLKSERPKRKYQKFQKKPNNHLKGKPERNALTNIGNQILTFVYLKKKNFQTIQSCFPDLSSEELRAYYSFAKEIKQSMYGYINYEKLASLWYPCEEEIEDALNTKILRTLSYFYIRKILVQSILTSKKMPSSVKPMHLRVRRKLLYFIKTHKLKAE